jgi:hypothetical protein
MILARSRYFCSAATRIVRLPPGLLLLSLLPTVFSAQTQDWRKQLASPDATLGTVRRIFQNQNVVVRGSSVADLRGSLLLHWTVARQDGEWYVESNHGLDNLPTSYKGKTANVIAVQLNKSSRREQTRNAFGEIVSDDATVHPYFDLVVRFDDGALAMTTAFPLTVTEKVEMASAAGALAEQMTKELPLLIGKNVYAVGFSKLYQPDTTLDELTGTSDILKRLSPTSVPRLVPLPILAAKYVDGIGVVFKLKLPNGSDALAFTPRLYYQEGTPFGDQSDRTFSRRVSGNLLVEIPSDLSQKDIDDIKVGSVSKGMRRRTLYYVVGFPDKENNWGRGGKQLMYGNRLLFYLDENERVVDWQSVDR